MMTTLMALTSGGYIFLLVTLLAIALPYYFNSGKKEKPGCVAVGLGAIIAWVLLMAPATISIQLFETGNTPIRIGIVCCWLVLLGVLIAIKRSKKANLGWSIAMYAFFAVGAVLFAIMIAGMAYFVYLRMFTHEKDDAPVWAVFLCIFFVAVIVLAVIGQLFNTKKLGKDGETDFDNLDKAKLSPEAVQTLSLSGKGYQKFPPEILNFTNLVNLDLSNNEINELPADILKLKYLASIKLSGNPIDDAQRSKIRKLFPPETELIFRT
ncbi:hypothetical protein LPB86_05645 [Pedobacter sp. MC2016-14]|uniref:hypothetical protein n=1 Tax=Pedobacter sp. MC2016-14 TaxID=2897327 RepID=UPI001E514AC3|nr:hypothetical protein [Pedobacter sp. MC2016-14]MCD0487701.1 hypothetical protein [Pedobacter sp. MC2016-14]